MNKKYQIVRSDNFGNTGGVPGFDEVFVLFPLSHDAAFQVADILNNESSVMGSYFYRAVESGYKLQAFEP